MDSGPAVPQQVRESRAISERRYQVNEAGQEAPELCEPLKMTVQPLFSENQRMKRQILFSTYSTIITARPAPWVAILPATVPSAFLGE